MSRDLRQEVRRIAGAQIDKAAAALADFDRDVHGAIHEARKRLKRIRALLRLVRDAAPALYQTENTSLRDAARTVSELRDAAALVETAEALAEHARETEGEALKEVHEKLCARRDAMAETADPLARVRHALSDAPPFAP